MTSIDGIFLKKTKQNPVFSLSWVNKKSGKSYVGSGVDLSKRLYYYCSKKHLEAQLKVGKSKISSSILKNGLSEFLLEILEYCEPEKCIEREQYYIDLLEPEYNILASAGSCLGLLHSDETKKRMSETR